jgi:heme-degrading monooxygenase HmoA
MYARTIRYDGITEAEWKVGSGWFENDYLPIAEQTEGFQGALLLVDRKRGNVISLTLWRDEETAAASEAAVQKHLDHYEEMTGISSPTETFEVAVDRVTDR